MKKIIISAFLVVFILSGCFVFEVNDKHRGGPPVWAPAHGYRWKHPTNTIYFRPVIKGEHEKRH